MKEEKQDLGLTGCSLLDKEGGLYKPVTTLEGESAKDPPAN
jgi:hypothetical protein